MKKIAFISKKFEPKTGKSKHILDLSRKLKNYKIILITNKCLLDGIDELPKNLEIRIVKSSDQFFYFKYKEIIEKARDCKKIVFFGGLASSIFIPLFAKKRKIIFDIRDIPTQAKEFKTLRIKDIFGGLSFVLNIDDIIGFFLKRKILDIMLNKRNISKVIISANGLKERFGLELMDKIEYIPYGIDVKRYSPIKQRTARKNLGIDKEDFIVFFYGRAVMLRGIDTLLESFEEVRKKKQVKLILNLLPDLNLNNVIKMVDGSQFRKDIVMNIGRVSNSEDYISSADLIVFPFKTSGCIPTQPLTLLESMAIGKPVISTKIGYLNEIIENEKNGFLLGPNSEKELTKKIIEIMENKKLLENVSKEARLSILLGYNLDKTSKKYGEILE